jgi:hypothetical protein
MGSARTGYPALARPLRPQGGKSACTGDLAKKTTQGVPNGRPAPRSRRGAGRGPPRLGLRRLAGGQVAGPAGSAGSAIFSAWTLSARSPAPASATCG